MYRTGRRSENADLKALEMALNLIHDNNLDSFAILFDCMNVLYFMISMEISILSYSLANV